MKHNNNAPVTAKKGFYLEGTVVSDKMEKTAVVEVETAYRHPVFGKVVRKKKKYKVHDPESLCKVGNFVKIKLVAPISKTKNMILEKVLR